MSLHSFDSLRQMFIYVGEVFDKSYKTRMTPVMNFCGFHGRVNSRRKQNYNRVQKYLEELKFITKIDTTRNVKFVPDYSSVRIFNRP